MQRLPLLEGVLEYIKEENVSFCMPGHKNGLGFIETEEGNILYDNIIKLDITEVEGVDNFHKPCGIIYEAQKLLTEYYKSKKSYFLVNGSTSGNQAMIFSCFDEGDKIIVERNCHRSIMNAIILRKLVPVYIDNKINKKYDAPLSIDEEHCKNIINDNIDARGIIITYPNYYGVCVNLELIIKEAQKNKMYVIVDSAHGAHFGVYNKLPESAVELGADMVVTSSHKTLPSFTQTGYLHINNINLIDKVDFYVSAFSSTSPSYMLMCSMDYARYYLEARGEKDYKRLVDLCEKYRDKINKIQGIHIIEMKDLSGQAKALDITRFIINIRKGYSAELLMQYLRKNRVQVEMCDNQNLILILSPFNKEKDFEKLYYALKDCDIENFKNNFYDLLINELPKMKLLPYEVLGRDTEIVDLEKSENKICAEAVVPYPPGIPIIMPGEVISQQIIEIARYYLRNNSSMLGIINNNANWKIKILKE
ncbi:aminotransferase class V-fold PLP-dependent enzyme [Clostridium sediminicola]|uniref:aminotransferase class I/II-fold pyridoxal phosphate-dependent enzyme n=1 Tax=Clostridium sediminicola TaxID=3114879 RepID=UPI0031F220BB